MQFHYFISLFLLFGQIFAEDETEEFDLDNGVYVLTSDNFDKFLEKYPTALVEFYAPWCGHCKQLAPKYEEAAKTLTDKTPFVPLAKVDTTVETELGTKFEIQGYPTLKFWKDGEKSDYDGPRDAEGIVSWIQERTDPNYKPPPEAVLTLTSDNFEQTTNNADIILVEFYAPWCGHCKQLAPELEKAAQKLQAHDPPIPLAKVDATKEADLAKDFGVNGYPTIKIMRKGKKFEYNGPRDAEGIVSYMKEQSKPAAKELKSVQEVQRFMSKDDITVVGFFASDESKLFENFMDAAESVREDFPALGYTVDPETIKHFKAKPNYVGIYQAERYWSKYEPKYKFLEKEQASREDISAFIKSNSVPLVGQRTQANQGKKYTKRPLVVVYYPVNFEPALREGTQYWRNKVLQISQEFKQYQFAICDEDEFAKELEEVGLGESGMEVNAAVFGADNRRFPMRPDDYDDEFTTDSFREFMNDVNKGRGKPYIKSQPIPKDDKSPVKTLVAANFEKVVMDESKDVMVEFYAPWCGHCKKLEPVYLDMAKSLKSDPNLVIAKFDATANDPPTNFKVEGFPTIYFVPSGSKSAPMKYEGERKKEDMIKFIKNNAKKSFQNKKEEL